MSSQGKLKFILFLLIFNDILNGAEAFYILGSKSDKTRKNEFTAAPTKTTKLPSILKKCDPCPSSVNCVPPIQCPAHVRMKAHELPQKCDLANGSHGYCCQTGRNHTIVNSKLRSHVPTVHEMNSIMQEAREHLDVVLKHRSHSVHRGNPEFLHNMMFHSSQRDILKDVDRTNRAMEQLFASQIYKDRENVPIEEFELDMDTLPFLGPSQGRNCPPVPSCPDVRDSKYRTPDGTCNNPLPHRSVWGAAGQPMERLLPPAYEDGLWAPRSLSIDGTPLRSARTISRLLLPDVNRPHHRYNLLLMQFGQFISHDFTQSASLTTGDGQAVQCCNDDGSDILPPKLRHFACLPISIDPDDDFYKTFNQGCLNFVRSSLAPHYDCRLGYGKQMSKVTHFLDASTIYGSDLATQAEVRSFRDGKLRMFDDFGRDLLPITNDRDTCSSVEAGNVCFLAGDGRTNQIISLTALHVIFAREHNRIASVIGHLNPHYSDELIFQEAKRIVTAEIQHITYNEWLPLVVGTETLKKFDLVSEEYGYSVDYSPDINPAITNEFSGAAFRFGHSTVDGKFKIHREGSVNEIIEIPDVMFNPSRLRQRNFLDNLLKTLIEQPMQEVDNFLTYGLSRFLFRAGSPFGLDLAALNIQRSRDHGIRPYNDYLEVIGHRRVKSFDEFGPEVGSKLAKVYNHPDDIELWVGGLMESANEDSLLGLTFSEIITDQFSRFRKGDRYFFDNDPSINPGHFSPKQLQEIRKVSMARIICDNADHFTLTAVSPYAFVRPDIKGNAPAHCHDIPSMNLELWRE